MFCFEKQIVKILICKLLYRVKYENLQIVEQYPKCFLCPNHSNIFDALYIFPVIDDLYIMSKSEIFKNKWITKILLHYKVLPIKRNKTDVIGVKNVLNIFKKNATVKFLIFPEGGILEEKNRARKIKNGAVYMASFLEKPIIPIYITQNPKLFSKVIVKFADPIFLKKEDRKEKDNLNKKSKELIKKIYQL